LVIENDENDASKAATVLREAETHICNQFNIHHTTIQVEQEFPDKNLQDTNHCGAIPLN